MVETGSISIFLAFVISIYVLVASIYGVRTRKWDFVRSAENGAIAVCFLLFIATIALVHSLINLDFTLKYVALNTSTDLATIYRFTSLWAGQAGSLLLWCLVLSVYTAIVVLQSRNRDRELMPYVLATLATVSIFFISIITFVENPFEKLPFTPQEGRGLNPILQNAYMAIHPLTLYFGYVVGRGLLLGTYPYPFFDISKIGYVEGLKNGLFLLAAFGGLGFLVRLTSLLQDQDDPPGSSGSPT